MAKDALKIRNIRLDQLFFFLFLLSIPFQKRLVFNTNFSHINGIFFEWGTMFLYVSDVLLGLTLFFWMIRLIRERNSHSSFVIRHSFIKTPLFWLVLFIIWCAISLYSTFNILHSTNIGIYHIIKLLEFSLLFLYIIKNINTKKLLKIAIFCLILTALFQSFLGIAQLSLQSSVGLKIIGEDPLSTSINNVAELDLFGVKYLRAYGTFPHPNVFGGFLATVLILSFGFWLPRTKNWVLSTGFFAISGVLSLALILTFSRVAWLAFVVGMLVFAVLNLKTFKNRIKMFHVKHFLSSLISLIVYLILVILILWPLISSKLTISNTGETDLSLSHRVSLQNNAFEFIKKSPILGVGIGGFTLNLLDTSNLPAQAELWRIQPVHNVYLLIAAEVGIIGLLLFIAFLVSVLKKAYLNWKDSAFEQKVLISGVFCAFIAFLIIMGFDHYLWTLQQGELIFWVTLGFLSSTVIQSKSS